MSNETTAVSTAKNNVAVLCMLAKQRKITNSRLRSALQNLSVKANREHDDAGFAIYASAYKRLGF